MILHLDFIEGEMAGKTVKVELSRRAQKALGKLDQPLFVTMEVYFSCFVVKKVQFSVIKPVWDTFEAAENLNIGFRVIQSAPCNIHDLKGDNTPDYIEFPIKKRKAILPHHLKIDYSGGEWKGTYTWNFRQAKEKAVA